MQINFEELENLLKQGQLGECLAKLEKYSQEANYGSLTNEILSEQSRLKTLNKRYNTGLITFEAFGSEETKIRLSIITLFDKINSKLRIVGENINEDTQNSNFKNEKELLVGVWGCKHSSISSSDVYIWSLLPDGLCIVNILNKKLVGTDSKVFKWEYDKENRIIIQRSQEEEIKGMVEWISPMKFKLTVLNLLKSVMIYEKII